MDFEFDTTTIGLTIGLWILIMVGLWFIPIGEGWALQQKIIISVIALPLTYFVTAWQIGR